MQGGLCKLGGVVQGVGQGLIQKRWSEKSFKNHKKSFKKHEKSFENHKKKLKNHKKTLKNHKKHQKNPKIIYVSKNGQGFLCFSRIFNFFYKQLFLASRFSAGRSPLKMCQNLQRTARRQVFIVI